MLNFLVMADSLCGPRPPRCWGSEITPRHITLGTTLLDEWSARRRDLYLTIHKTHFPPPPNDGGIWTRNLSKRTAADTCLRPRGHEDRHIIIYRDKFSFATLNDKDDANNNHNNLSTSSRYKIVLWAANTKFSAVHIPNISLKLYTDILIHIQQDATLHSLFYLETALHVSGGKTTHHQERKQLYPQHLAGSSNGVTNNRCCRYSCLHSWWWVVVPSETCRAFSR